MLLIMGSIACKGSSFRRTAEQQRKGGAEGTEVSDRVDRRYSRERKDGWWDEHVRAYTGSKEYL